MPYYKRPDYSWFYYPPSTPRAVRGGIRSQARRGSTQNWWAERWMAVLYGFGMGARLNRGRSYANQGQVTSLDIGKGGVTAKVQGSRSRPYKVNIKIKHLTASQWKGLAEEIIKHPAVAAALLSGRMPDGVEKLFKSAGLSLFPDQSGDVKTDCNCPDWANPCKHIAAVYILLGEEFDRDPFVLFQMRGSGRDQILKMAGLRGESGYVHEEDAEPPQPLAADAARFWGREGPGVINSDKAATIPVMAAALPKRLGAFPLWRGSEDFAAVMEEAYRAASPAGMDAFTGEGFAKTRADV